MEVLRKLTDGIIGAVGVADNGDGTYRVDLADGTSREASDDEILAAKVATVAEQIKAERDRRKGLGVTVGEHRFHSDDASRIQQIGLVMFGASMPAGIKWKTMDGAFVEMTPALAQQIFAAQTQRDMILFAACELHIAAARASDDPLKYDYLVGWPD